MYKTVVLKLGGRPGQVAEIVGYINKYISERNDKKTKKTLWRRWKHLNIEVAAVKRQRRRRKSRIYNEDAERKKTERNRDKTYIYELWKCLFF